MAALPVFSKHGKVAMRPAGVFTFPRAILAVLYSQQY